MVAQLIALGVAIAASIIASEMSASASESDAEDEAGRQRELAKKQQQMDYWINMASKSPTGRQTAELMRSRSDRYNIEQGYQGAMRAAEKQADQSRLNGWLSAGQMAVGGLANAAMSSGSDRAPGLADALGGNDSLAERAGQMSLDAGAYGLLQGSRLNDTPQPIRQADPAGGFQLQAQDYRLLGGAGSYAHSPYNDDEYGTGVGYANPNRFRFGL